MSVLLHERRGGVEILTLNRPEVRNAINVELAEAIADALDRVEADRDVSAIVVAGSGSAFCAGADLRVIAEAGGPQSLIATRGGFGGITRRLVTKPVIAAVHGPAVAGGFEIVLACDMVVASHDARFGLPEVQRGLVAGAGGLIRLPQRLPRAVALELIATGDPLDGTRAHALGLVNRLVDGDAAVVVDAAVALGERIAANSPIAVRESLRLARAVTGMTDDDAWALNAEIGRVVHSSPDVAEGPRAFLEKRPPNWQRI
jgi:enoyl-CoA hydratase/carnithine racemase